MEFSHEDSRKGKYENHIQYNTNPPQRKNSSGQSHISGMNPLHQYMKVGKIRLTSVVNQEGFHNMAPELSRPPGVRIWSSDPNGLKGTWICAIMNLWVP
jgi:hypothetical protein